MSTKINPKKKANVKIIKRKTSSKDSSNVKQKKAEKPFIKRANKEEEGDYDELEREKDLDTESEEEEETVQKEEKQQKGDEDDETLDEENLDDDKTKKDEDVEEYEKPARDEDEGCLYNFNKVNNDDDNEEDNEDIGLTDEENEADKIKAVEERITKPFLTKYERVRALGARAKQLSMGAKPMLKGVENFSAKEVAKLELENKVMPFIVERPLPNGKIEVWDINELIINN